MPSFFSRIDENLESPFLNEEIASRDADREANEQLEAWTPELHHPSAELEDAFAEERLVEEQLAEEEILGSTDDRTVIPDTLRTPNRWICAIDILTANPKWGQPGQSRHLIQQRGTGVLIGPRYVLTAAHALGALDRTDRMAVVQGFRVSPGRNGDNSSSPLGTFASKSVRVSANYWVTLPTGAQRTPTRQLWRDDYALIILDRDINSQTHKTMTGPLGYWGSDPSIAEVRRLDPAALGNTDAVVIGYPGDTCGATKYTGTEAQKTPKIANCFHRQRDKWASCQWRANGVLTVDPSLRVLYHTADTYAGQSGGPICVTIDGKLHLAGIHTGPHHTAQNKGYRLTRRMLKELQTWINAEAGYAAVSIQGDVLRFQPKPQPASTRQLETPPAAKASEIETEGLQEELEDFQTSGHHYESSGEPASERQMFDAVADEMDTETESAAEAGTSDAFDVSSEADESGEADQSGEADRSDQADASREYSSNPDEFDGQGRED